MVSNNRRAIICACDFGSAFEYVENACIAQMRDTGVSSAKPLPPWICTALSAQRPGHARRDQLRHAGFKVAAPPFIPRTRCKIRHLPGDHGFHRHHRNLVGDAWKRDNSSFRTACVPAQLCKRHLHRRLSNTHGSAQRSECVPPQEGLHQLPETRGPRRLRSRFSDFTKKPSNAISYSFIPR